MDPETLIILALIGGAAWLYFQGTPVSPTSAQTSPTPTATPLTPAPTPSALTPGTTVAASTAASAGGGTTVSPRSASVPSDQTFLNQVTPADDSKDWINASWEAKYLTLSMMSQMRLSASATDSGCSSFQSSSVTFQQAAGLATTGVTTGISVAATAGSAVAAAAIPFIGIGVGIVGLVMGIFSAHKKKVQEQAQLDCAGVAAANNVLDEIDSALAAGSITPAQAKAGWEAVYSQFQQTVAPMIKDDSSHCNGPCILQHVLRAIVNKYEYIYGV